MLQSLRRVSILSNERYKGIRLEFSEDKVSLSASNPDLGEAVEEIEADYKGKTISIGLTRVICSMFWAFLAAMAMSTSNLKDELSPSVIRKARINGYLYVLMPMRLSD